MPAALTTSARCALRHALALAAVLAVLAGALAPASAEAHSLTSSTVAVRVSEDAVDATISVAVATLEQAMDAELADGSLSRQQTAAVEAYLAEHLRATGKDGERWTVTVDGLQREAVEGIDSLSVEAHLAPSGASTDAFTLAYDAVIEAVPGHEAVVVLTDSAGDISTAGVLDADHRRLTITDTAQPAAWDDMVRHGFHHVLEGADHLLFLLALLLPAPFLAAGGRWRPGASTRRTVVSVLHVVTAFTLGHSLTLIAAALGWVTVPSGPVEVLIAASVAVAAVHAIRPLTTRGGTAVALVFGLVHGLAFAGILSDLGLVGAPSLGSLLAFNLGVELAQLACVAAVLPSLWLLARTRFATPVRIGGASLAVVAATAWGLERLGAVANPLAGVEQAAVAHLPSVAAVLAGLALLAWLRTPAPPASTAGAAPQRNAPRSSASRAAALP